jgi:2-methylcitrate dehydratase PrpD
LSKLDATVQDEVSELTANVVDLVVGAADPDEATFAAAATAVLDYLGAAAAGGSSSAARILGVGQGVADLPPFVSMPVEAATACQTAALLNGTRGHALEIDDYYVERYPLGHLASPVLGSVFALAGTTSVSGRQFLRAVLDGWEVAGRVHRAIGPTHYGRGFHATGTIGSFGAAAGAATLLGLDKAETVAAVGVAGSLAAGLIASMHSYVKPLHAGNAARNGVLGATLARDGYWAAANILGHRKGFLRALSGETSIDSEPLLEAVGEWAIHHNSYKIFYTACFDIADITVATADEESVEADEVASLEFGSIADFTENQVHADPQNVTAAKLSTQYVAAVSLLDREFGIRQVNDARLIDADVRDLMRKVAIHRDDRVAADMEDGHYPISLRMTLNSGTVIERYIQNTRGFYRNPVDHQVLVAKFLDLSSPVIGKDRAERVVELVHALPTDSDGAVMSDLVAALGTT